MSFHPRMYADVSGFEAVGGLQSLVLDQIAVDYWRVRGEDDAHGRYVSMYPRFVFLLDGKRIWLSTGAATEPVACAACFVPAGVDLRGRIGSGGDLRHVDIHLPLKRLKSLIGSDANLSDPIFLPELGNLDALAALLASECLERGRSVAHATLLVQALLAEFFHRAGLASVRAQHDRELSLSKLRGFALAHLDKRISVADLATAAGMSRSHFNRVFRRRAGTSPHQWLLALRVEHAQALLLRGYSFAQTADAVGFADQPHFNRVFKAVTGEVPTVWMNEQGTAQVV